MALALKHAPLLLAGLLGLAACGDMSPTMNPDYAIRVVPQPDGSYAAVPPECPDYTDNIMNRFDNQPPPQFGCAYARNLAIMVDRPSDLIQGRDSGFGSGLLAAGSIVRYNNNQTRGLVDPATDSNTVATTTAPSSASSMTGETTAAGTGGSSGGGIMGAIPTGTH